MEADFERARRAARRAYELGRLGGGLKRALVVAAAAAGASAVVVGWHALAWLPVSVIVWTFVEWRGAWLREGARRGLLGGLASLFLPLSILRPCCSPEAMASGVDCCTTTMPSTCAGVGALLGLSLALLLPRAPPERRLETALGLALGTGALAALRCGPLLLGEAVGLLGGLLAGLVAACVARAGGAGRAA